MGMVYSSSTSSKICYPSVTRVSQSTGDPQDPGSSAIPTSGGLVTSKKKTAFVCSWKGSNSVLGWSTLGFLHEQTVRPLTESFRVQRLLLKV